MTSTHGQTPRRRGGSLPSDSGAGPGSSGGRRRTCVGWVATAPAGPMTWIAASAKAAGAATLNYGMFLNTVINFLIVAFAIYLLVRQVNKLRAQPAPAPAGPPTKSCPFCCSAIPLQATRCPQCTSELENA